jgi:hypothetical protein
MTSRKSHPTPAGAVFIGIRQLQERWGGISHMTVERRLRDDPSFPKPRFFGRLRFWKIADVEAYERACVVEKRTA